MLEIYPQLLLERPKGAQSAEEVLKRVELEFMYCGDICMNDG